GAAAPEPRAKTKLTAAAAVVMGGLAVLILFGAWWYARSRSDPPSLAVIPLANLGTSPGDDYFSEGITEDVVAELSRFSGFKAVVRLRSEGRQHSVDRRRLAKNLGVSFILAGTFLRTEHSLQIEVTLANPESDRIVWHRDYRLPLDKVFAAPRDIARNVAAALEVPLDATPELSGRHETDLESHKLSLQARYFRNLETWEGFRKAEQYYRQALERDPANARAWAGLAEVYLLMAGSGAQDEWARKAEQATAKALALGPAIPETHVANGMVLKRCHRDYPGAEAAFKEALKLAPRHADARREYGLLLMRELGRLDEALAQLEYAANLDPLSTRISSNLSELYRARGEFDKAMRAASKHLELNFRDPRSHRNIALAYFLLGDNDKALHWARKCTAIQHEQDRGRHFERGLQLLTLVQLYSGRIEEARQTSRWILDLDPTSTQGMATAGMVALWRGDYSEAAARLEAAAQLDPSGFLWPGGVRLSTMLGHILSESCDPVGAQRALALSDRLNRAESVPEGSRILVPDRVLDIVAVHAVRGEAREAIDLLRRMVDSGYRSLVFIKKDPWFTALRHGPEFRTLCDRMQREVDAMIGRVEAPPDEPASNLPPIRVSVRANNTPSRAPVN
ncbi:MAG: tetratricopeptide repeat protein, partial [Acidobacteria bacterium]|nr:tetratricopeptide repeat protein [Acidobacteriota bacterium]